MASFFFMKPFCVVGIQIVSCPRRTGSEVLRRTETAARIFLWRGNGGRWQAGACHEQVRGPLFFPRSVGATRCRGAGDDQVHGRKRERVSGVARQGAGGDGGRLRATDDAPVELRNDQQVVIRNATVKGTAENAAPVKLIGCTDVKMERVTCNSAAVEKPAISTEKGKKKDGSTKKNKNQDPQPKR